MLESPPSFTVKNYAARPFSISFDFDVKHMFPPIPHENEEKDAYYQFEKQTLLNIQSHDTAVFDIKLFIQSMCPDVVDIFGNDLYFNVHFMNTREPNKVYYSHYFGGDTVMGGYMEFILPSITTIPNMAEKLEAFMERINARHAVNNAPMLKFVHLTDGMVYFSCQMMYEDIHKLRVKDGQVFVCQAI